VLGFRYGLPSFILNCITHYHTGSINGAESAFVYRNGTNHSDYHNASYVPNFLDEMKNKTLRDEAVLACGDASNVQCIFDYIFTDIQIAEQTLKNDKKQQSTSFEIGMSICTIKRRSNWVISGLRIRSL